MSKAPPAFQFYPGDFLQGAAEMTLEEIGLYIRLLCRQWITGSVPSDAARAATLAQTTVDTFERLWPVVGQKFESGTDGRLRNARLEAEREKQRAWREGQTDSGRRGAEARWGRTRRGAPDGNQDGKPIGNPNSDPNGKPNGKNMPLHSSLFSPHPLTSAPGANSLTNAPRPNEQAEQFFHVLGFNSVLEEGVEEGTAFLVKRWVDDGCPTYVPDLVSLLDEALTAAKVQSIKTGGIFWQRLHKLRNMLSKQRRMSDEELLQHSYASQRSGSA